MAKLFANSEDPDQTLCYAASDLGLHCLPVTLLGVSRLQWVEQTVSKLKLQWLKLKKKWNINVLPLKGPIKTDQATFWISFFF